MLKIALLATRGLQMVFSAAILGLSVQLAKGQLLGRIPTTTGYAAFLGGLGLLAGAYGLVNVFIPLFEGTPIINIAIDGFVTLLFLAGGIIVAITIKGGKCGLEDIDFLIRSKLINCGAIFQTVQGTEVSYGLCGYNPKLSDNDLVVQETKALRNRCDEFTADYGLMFAVAVLSIFAIVMGLAWRKKGRGGYVI